MFGGQDDSGMGPQNGPADAPQDDTMLHGVSDLTTNGPQDTLPDPEPMAATSARAEPDMPANDQPTEPPTTPMPDSTPSTDDDLLELKQQALQQLSPLVGHLDQTPEEKFRTTMMLIQASDNQSLLKEALLNAVSIAGTSITMGALVVEVPEKKESAGAPDMGGMMGM